MKGLLPFFFVFLFGCGEVSHKKSGSSDLAVNSEKAPTLNDTLAPKVKAYLFKKDIDTVGYKPISSSRLGAILAKDIFRYVDMEWLAIRAGVSAGRFRNSYAKYLKYKTEADSNRLEGYVMTHTFSTGTGSSKDVYVLTRKTLYVTSIRENLDFGFEDYANLAVWPRMYLTAD